MNDDLWNRVRGLGNETWKGRECVNFAPWVTFNPNLWRIRLHVDIVAISLGKFIKLGHSVLLQTAAVQVFWLVLKIL